MYFIIGSHLIGKLLKPFMQGTLIINFHGRNTLWSPKQPLVDDLFSVGLVGALELIRKHSNFSNLNFPKTMEERGLPEDESDGLKDFFFRSDGYKLWHIIKNYVRGIVYRIYPNDSSVKQDAKLQEYTSSIANPDMGNIPNFPATVHTRWSLVTLLTTILFSPSVFHQVRSYLLAFPIQYPIFSYFIVSDI